MHSGQLVSPELDSHMRLRTASEPPPADLDSQAAQLNRQCYADNPAVDADLVTSIKRQMLVIFDLIYPGYVPDYRNGWLMHSPRLAATIQFLRRIGFESDLTLEIGEVSVASYILEEYFPNVRWRRAHWDIRLRWPTPENHYDSIICTEVLEHLCDLERDTYSVWRGSGLSAFLTESFRGLRPGGYLFASTPNAHSALCLHHVLHGYPPMFFQPHLREFGREELTRAAESCGFIVEEFFAVQCLTMDTGIDLTRAFRSLLVAGASIENRGDDWFILLRKPN